MNESFAIGEIAIVKRAFFPEWLGREVEVKSPLTYEPNFGYVYRIEADWLPGCPPNHTWLAEPDSLRKRPQPPDWNALSNPQNVPVEELV